MEKLQPRAFAKQVRLCNFIAHHVVAHVVLVMLCHIMTLHGQHIPCQRGRSLVLFGMLAPKDWQQGYSGSSGSRDWQGHWQSGTSEGPYAPCLHLDGWSVLTETAGVSSL